ncbi:MAG TPA: aminotransferase class I/II-fold pyridoxal phosphate-dependent enzyme [Candidatus Salinicoccus merdavium]|nr:aminotransferase class I/II-fold pyridoxal phosphate-dependent enzyme [Candidatus Salinicoccus merdavium]
MLDKINQRVTKLEIPGTRQFSNRVSVFRDGVNFTIGEPDIPTPYTVKKAAIKAIENNQTGYSHNAGLFELRESVSNFFKDIYDVKYDPEDEIVITIGASEGLRSIFETILNEGDEVIIPAPCYSAYEPLVDLLGASVTYMDTSDTDFVPDPEKLRSMITDKTKAVLLNFPSNPTGKVLSEEEMAPLVKELASHEIFIISDEIYSEITYDVKHISFSQYPELRDKLFLVHGLSKSHSMTGWRLGYVLGPAELMPHVLKVHLYDTICAALPSQYAAIDALDNSRHSAAEMAATYRERRDLIVERLTQIGLETKIPQGAFYVFPSIEKFNMTSYEFADRLLEEEHVAVVPGSGFTNFGEGFIRISYATSIENINEGLKRIERFVDGLS